MQSINYLGNPLLKRSNVPIDFTTEQVEEFIKCADDPIYFMDDSSKNINAVNKLKKRYPKVKLVTQHVNH